MAAHSSSSQVLQLFIINYDIISISFSFILIIVFVCSASVSVTSKGTLCSI